MGQPMIPDGTSLRETLKKELQLSADARYSHRLHVVLLVSTGYSCYEVANCFGESPRTIQRWVRNYQEFGFCSLQDAQKSGRPKKLSREQSAEVERDVQSEPRTFGYDQDKWVGKLLAAHIVRNYRVVLSARQCQRFLK